MTTLRMPSRIIVTNEDRRIAERSALYVESNLKVATREFAQIKRRFIEIAGEEAVFVRGLIAEGTVSSGTLIPGTAVGAFLRGMIENGEIGSVRSSLRALRVNGTHPTAHRISVFMRALATRNSDMVRTVASEGGNITVSTDYSNRDSLMHAVLTDDPTMVRLALEYCGRDLKWKDDFGQNVLDYANAIGNRDILGLLTQQ